MAKKRKSDLSELLKLPIRKTSPGVDYSKDNEVIATKTEVIINGKKAVLASWSCNPMHRNKLMWAQNDPVLAVEVLFSYGTINWCPGRNWPTYTVPQPLNASPAGDGFRFPAQPRHTIVWEIGSYYIWTGLVQGSGRGSKLDQVYVTVNDNIFNDNVGSFIVNIIAYSQV